MLLVRCMLVANVVWDLVSALALLHDGHGVVARLHTGWWHDEKDNTPQTRRVLALFLILLGIMRAQTRVFAVGSYGCEMVWLFWGVWCGTMTIERVWGSAVLCVVCGSAASGFIFTPDGIHRHGLA